MYIYTSPFYNLRIWSWYRMSCSKNYPISSLGSLDYSFHAFLNITTRCSSF